MIKLTLEREMITIIGYIKRMRMNLQIHNLRKFLEIQTLRKCYSPAGEIKFVLKPLNISM